MRPTSYNHFLFLDKQCLSHCVVLKGGCSLDFFLSQVEQCKGSPRFLNGTDGIARVYTAHVAPLKLIKEIAVCKPLFVSTSGSSRLSLPKPKRLKANTHSLRLGSIPRLNRQWKLVQM